MNRSIGTWLAVCALSVLAVVVFGGYTRLTYSGLSIVEWEPIVGVVPPVGQAQWDEAFAKYRETPEYLKVNRGMSLEEFKAIYWVEWLHRILGRASGLVFGVPLLYWLLRRRLSRPLAVRLLSLFILGGLQGVLGWYMVASGLVDVPRVSPYRLTAHLGLAAILLGLLWWTALDQWHPDPQAPHTPPGMRRLASTVVAVTLLTILSGGLVAGTRAGFAFNTFPLMAGRIIPDGLYADRSVLVSAFEHVLSVQFNHRLAAIVLTSAVLALLWRARRPDVPAPVARAALAVAAGLALQAALGVATLLWVVPVPLAVAHQGWAMVLLCLALAARHLMRPASRRTERSSQSGTIEAVST